MSTSSGASSWGVGWLWAAVGLAEPEPEPEPEPELTAEKDGGDGGGGGGASLAAVGKAALPGVGDEAEQAQQLLLRLVGDWEVSGSEAAGFLSLDESYAEGEPRKLVGDLQLGDSAFEVYGVASVAPLDGTMWLNVATGELQHVYAEFEGRLELRLPAAEGGTRMEISLVMQAPEGHSEYHVAGDMSASQVQLEWHGLEGARAD
jgi:hypothetical protein